MLYIYNIFILKKIPWQRAGMLLVFFKIKHKGGSSRPDFNLITPFTFMHSEFCISVASFFNMLFVFFLQVIPCQSSYLEAFKKNDLAKSKEIAIFLDYDETPPPIFYDPQKGYISSEVNKLS